MMTCIQSRTSVWPWEVEVFCYQLANDSRLKEKHSCTEQILKIDFKILKG